MSLHQFVGYAKCTVSLLRFNPRAYMKGIVENHKSMKNHLSHDHTFPSFSANLKLPAFFLYFPRCLQDPLQCVTLA